MDITNKTSKPLRAPLPGGKTLFLGPGKTGQVTAKAIKHPPLVKLLESGDLESSQFAGKSNDGASRGSVGSSGGSKGRQQSGGAAGAMRQAGDR